MQWKNSELMKLTEEFLKSHSKFVYVQVEIQQQQERKDYRLLLDAQNPPKLHFMFADLFIIFFISQFLFIKAAKKTKISVDPSDECERVGELHKQSNQFFPSNIQLDYLLN